MEEKHVHWKRPAVDKILKHEQTLPPTPQDGQSKQAAPVKKAGSRVHWKEPAVESVHEYDKNLPPSRRMGWKDPVVQGRYSYPKVPTVIGPSPDLSEAPSAKGTYPTSVTFLHLKLPGED